MACAFQCHCPESQLSSSGPQKKSMHTTYGGHLNPPRAITAYFISTSQLSISMLINNSLEAESAIATRAGALLPNGRTNMRREKDVIVMTDIPSSYEMSPLAALSPPQFSTILGSLPFGIHICHLGYYLF